MSELVFSKFSTFYSTFVENDEKRRKTKAENSELLVFRRGKMKKEGEKRKPVRFLDRKAGKRAGYELEIYEIMNNTRSTCCSAIFRKVFEIPTRSFPEHGKTVFQSVFHAETRVNTGFSPFSTILGKQNLIPWSKSAFHLWKNDIHVNADGDIKAGRRN